MSIIARYGVYRRAGHRGTVVYLGYGSKEESIKRHICLEAVTH